MAEEIKNENTPVVEAEVKPDYIVIEKEDKDVDFVTKIEDLRKGLYAKYKANRTRSNIMMAVVVVIMIAVFIMIGYANSVPWLQYVAYGLGGVTLVGMIVYYLLTKKAFPDATKEYIKNVTVAINQHVFSHGDFSDVKYYGEKKVERAEILSDKVYKDVVDSGSRNYVEAKFADQSIFVSEVALYIAGEKRQQKKVAFVGKYISKTNDLHFEDRIIINIKGEKGLDVATYVDDLSVIEEINGMVVYAKEGTDYKGVLGNKFIEGLSSLLTNTYLLNVNLVFWAGHTAVYLSYDDPVTAIPFDKPFTSEPTDYYRDQLVEVLKLLEKLGK